MGYGIRALPLIWSVHRGKRGIVHAKDQTAPLRGRVPLIPQKTEVWVVGDAGFGRVALMRWLGRRHRHYYLRVNSAYHYSRRRAGWAAVATIPVQEGRHCSRAGFGGSDRRTSAGSSWWPIGSEGRRSRGSWSPTRQRACGPSRLYRKRIWIKELFGDLKEHGFDLEATHLQDLGRLSRLALAAMIVYVWLIALGSRVIKRGLRYLVDRRDRRDKSLFRIGWDWIERCLALDK